MTLQTILKSSLLLAFIFSHCNGKTAKEWKGRIIYQVISLINLFIPQETPQHHPVTVFTVLYISYARLTHNAISDAGEVCHNNYLIMLQTLKRKSEKGFSFSKLEPMGSWLSHFL